MTKIEAILIEISLLQNISVISGMEFTSVLSLYMKLSFGHDFNEEIE